MVCLKHRCTFCRVPPHNHTRRGFLRAHGCVSVCIWPVFSSGTHSFVLWPWHSSFCQLGRQCSKVVGRLQGVAKAQHVLICAGLRLSSRSCIIDDSLFAACLGYDKPPDKAELLALQMLLTSSPCDIGWVAKPFSTSTMLFSNIT